MTKWNFMLAAVGIVALGGWLLRIIVSAVFFLPVDSMAPVAVDTDKRPVVIVPLQQPTQLQCSNCGVVVSMRLVTAVDDATVPSPVENAVVGSMMGNLLGGARGQELFGLLGAITAMRNGSVLHPYLRYETTIRFDNGVSRVFVDLARPQWRDGDRVRVIGGTIQAFSLEDAKLKPEVTLSFLFSVASVWI